MRNILFLSLFLQITNILTQGTKRSIPPLCKTNDQTLCEKDPKCYWDNLYCNNRVDCAQIPLSECEQTKTCHLNPFTPGYCYSAIKLNCQQFNQNQCLNNPYCFWQSSYLCIPKDPQPVIPKCASFNPVQCIKNSKYCTLNNSCQENTTFCQGLNYNQCIHDPICNYIFTQKEQCLENENYCKNLNEEQCLKNQFCIGQSLAPKCLNNFDCGKYSASLCKKNSEICGFEEKSYTCTRKDNNCSSYTNDADCKKAGCTFGMTSDGEFTCYYRYPCENFTEKQCKDNFKFCNYTPSSFTCTNKLDCSEIDSDLCKENKFCKYIPSEHQCLPKKESCNEQNAINCKKNPACTYIPPKGQCKNYKSVGCIFLNLLNCTKNKHCLIKYSCKQKPLPPCKSLTYNQCKQSSYCQLIDQGKCFNNEIDCDLPFEQCIATKPCLWNPGSNSSCTNEFECYGLTIEDCQQNESQCMVSGGCSIKAV